MCKLTVICVWECLSKTRYAWLTLSFFYGICPQREPVFLLHCFSEYDFFLISGLLRITTSLPMRPFRNIMSYWWEWIIGMPWPALSQSNDPVLAWSPSLGIRFQCVVWTPDVYSVRTNGWWEGTSVHSPLALSPRCEKVWLGSLCFLIGTTRPSLCLSSAI